MDMNVDPRAHRCPAVITATASPRYPGRRPFVTGDPCPSVVIVIIPPSIMERCPSPGEVRYPGVSIIGHHPISIGCIRMKLSPNVGNPDAAVMTVVDPSSVRSQFVIENVERYTTSLIAVVIISLFVIGLSISLRIDITPRGSA